MKAAFVSLAFAVALLPAPAFAATFRGVANAPAVVWITDQTPPPLADASIRQAQKTFVPDVLVIPAGTSVRFPNEDGFYHSVYSVSPANPFDLGLYDTGPGKSVVFPTPGIVEVRCHVHGTMHATIVVVDGPSVTTTHPAERYELNVSRGKHQLHVWTDGGAVRTSTIVVR